MQLLHVAVGRLGTCGRGAEEGDLREQVLGRLPGVLPRHGLEPLVDVGVHEHRAAVVRRHGRVAGAIALQRADLGPIRLRIGLHTGEVQLRDEGNYAGRTINKTARLRDLAHGGQTVMSSVTAELLEDGLPGGAWLIDLGRHTMRDLPKPIHVSQLCHSDLTIDFPPLRTVSSAATQHLPTQLTTFIGRGPQITEIIEILQENRLVTLTGAGSTGKTRLAIEVAGRIATVFSDGVWYVDLAPITHPEVVPVAVARALGLPDQPGRSIGDRSRPTSGTASCCCCSTTANICWMPALCSSAGFWPNVQGDGSGDQSRATTGSR